MMKKVLFLLLMISFGRVAYGQDFYAMLDTAYIEYCKHNDPNNDKIFFENWTYLTPNGYTIAKQKKTRIYKQHNGSHKDISGKYCIDYPSIYFSEDSIYIVNHDLQANDKEFYFGISYISLFTYDRLNNKWNYSKGFIPELEFRNESSMQKMLKQCFLKAIDTIKKHSTENSISIYRISDCCGHLGLTESDDIPYIPYGEELSNYKSKADYFVGYPEITLNKDVFCVSFKIIRSDQIGKSFKLDDAQTVSVSHNIKDSF
ncbi:MAG: hypothetical protein II900_06185 [Prevotella sp.]|nr:hypothetical protein [Prevotella sp.]